jgi:hypothetical protein
MTTDAPSATKRVATASPNPCAAPVTICDAIGQFTGGHHPLTAWRQATRSSSEDASKTSVLHVAHVDSDEQPGKTTIPQRTPLMALDNEARRKAPRPIA